MKLAQQEIKATVTVNTSDLGSKRKDEDSNDKDTQTRKKGQGSHPWSETACTTTWVFVIKSIK